jgi:segregation and condensation protein B
MGVQEVIDLLQKAKTEMHNIETTKLVPDIYKGDPNEDEEEDEEEEDEEEEDEDDDEEDDDDDGEEVDDEDEGE